MAIGTMLSLAPDADPTPIVQAPSPMAALVAHVVQTRRTRAQERQWRAAYAIHERLVEAYRDSMHAEPFDPEHHFAVCRAMDLAWTRSCDLACAPGAPLANR